MGSIQKRLLTLFVLGVIIMTMVTGFIIVKYDNLIESNTQLSNNAHEIKVSSLRAQIFFKTQVQEWKNILLRGHDNVLYHKHLDSFLLYEKKTRKEVKHLLNLASEYPKLKKDAVSFINNHKKLGLRYREALPVYKLAENNPHITTDKYVRGIDREPIKLLSHIVKNTKNIFEAALHKKRNDFNNLKYFLVSVFVATSILLVIIFWFVAKKGISQPLSNMSSLLKNIAEGDRDLTQRLESHNVSELKLTAHWFNIFIANIQQLMSQINKAANNLSFASYNSAKTIERTNQAIINQQTAITHVSESMHQMSNNIKIVAENAQLTAESTKSALASTAVGHNVVMETISEINLLSDKINKSSNIVNQLVAESVDVDAILNVITAIAEQTNLLALNAAIEAARAGENGRGFAVVADEVRNLSQKTYQATVQIQQHVHNMQGSSKSAASAMQESQEQALRTVDLANRAGSSLKNIKLTLSEIDVMNKDIADSSASQSKSANDINSTIIEINNAITSTINDAQQNTSDSSDLAQLASLLHMLITQFKISEIEEDELPQNIIQEDNIELF